MKNSAFRTQLKISKICGYKNSCKNKVNYKWKYTANTVLDNLKQKYHTQELESYPCYFCGGWHIGRKIHPKEVSKLISQAGGILCLWKE